ncbi:hypothetical protein Nmel_005005 [Mimus melanotis]
MPTDRGRGSRFSLTPIFHFSLFPCPFSLFSYPVSLLPHPLLPPHLPLCLLSVPHSHPAYPGGFFPAVLPAVSGSERGGGAAGILADEAIARGRAAQRRPGAVRDGPGRQPPIRLLCHPARGQLLRQLPGTIPTPGMLRPGSTGIVSQISPPCRFQPLCLAPKPL